MDPIATPPVTPATTDSTTSAADAALSAEFQKAVGTVLAMTMMPLLQQALASGN